MEFESAFFDKDDYRYKARLNDNGNIILKEIDNHYEYFEPDTKGLYTCITEPDQRLRKVHGKSKDSKDKYGVFTPVYKYIRDFFWMDESKEKTGMKSGSYNMHPRLWYLDIETRALEAPDPIRTPNEVTLIQIYDSILKKMIVLGRKPYNPEEDYPHGVEVQYVCIEDEVKLLQTFIALISKLKPLIVYAWNGEGFDFPYLYNRMRKVGLEPQLSPFGETQLNEVKAKDSFNTRYKVRANGIHYMDMMDVYKAFVKAPRPSHSLDVISDIELKEHKIEHTEYPDFDSAYTGAHYIVNDKPYNDRIREKIRQLRIKYNETNDQNVFKEYQYYVNFMFVYYGIKDVYLMKRIDDKLQFSNIIMGISSMMGILPGDALGTVKPWAQYLSNVAYYENKVMPIRVDPDTIEMEGVTGGFVRDPVKANHRWIMNFDVNSMYPQLSIAAFNMSPDTFVPLAKAPAEIRDILKAYYYDQDEARVLKLYEEHNPVTVTLSELLKKYNLCVGINGALFKKDFLGIIPRLVNAIYDNRKKDKKEMIKYENQKVLIGEILSKRGIRIEN